MISYLDQAVPTSAWIESEPRAIQPAEREQLARATLTTANRIWLFERWLPPNDRPSPTAVFFNRHAFPIQEQWLEKSGKLTLYGVADTVHPAAHLPLNIPFQGGLTLIDVSLFDQPVKHVHQPFAEHFRLKHAAVDQDVRRAADSGAGLVVGAEKRSQVAGDRRVAFEGEANLLKAGDSSPLRPIGQLAFGKEALDQQLRYLPAIRPFR